MSEFEYSYKDLLCAQDEAILSLLYPAKDDKYSNEMLLKNPDSKIVELIEAYQNSDIKPFIRQIDLNDSNPDEDISPNNAWEIGIEFKF